MSDERVGICGDSMPQLMASSPALWCDLPAGHAGWHGATAPGMELIGVRTNWSNGRDDSAEVAAAEARGYAKAVAALRNSDRFVQWAFKRRPVTGIISDVCADYLEAVQTDG